MRVYEVDPTQDVRWTDLLERHPNASIFHSVSWLNSLRDTYGYEPVVFTTSPPDSDLKNGLVFCRVKSRLTGRRLVSLPFSDHCDPLCESAEDTNYLIRCLQTSVEKQGWRSLELRPIHWTFDQPGEGNSFRPAATYFLHTLDLRPNLRHLFSSLNKDSVQRRIQRAQRANLLERCGRSDDLLKTFYALFQITRARHQLPPTPYVWFQNLIRFHGDALEIRIAYDGGNAIAAILTLRFKNVLYYKYGCSDQRFNKLGATPWLFWSAITAAKSNGATEFDLGRTQEDHAGLLAFKNHWVPQPKRLVYWRFPDIYFLNPVNNWKLKMAKRIFSYMPTKLLAITGKLIYPHIG